jgi:hypothetical protein
MYTQPSVGRLQKQDNFLPIAAASSRLTVGYPPVRMAAVDEKKRFAAMASKARLVKKGLFSRRSAWMRATKPADVFLRCK